MYTTITTAHRASHTSNQSFVIVVVLSVSYPVSILAKKVEMESLLVRVFVNIKFNT